MALQAYQQPMDATIPSSAQSKHNHQVYIRSRLNLLTRPGLCRRRRWQEPSYEAYPTTTGYACIVRVNNREYTTDTECASEVLAREGAAMRAYLICRNFSVNDGMIPAGHGHRGAVQGIPVAIGTGRKSSRDDDDTSSSGGSWSGGSSPEHMVRLDALSLGHGRTGSDSESSRNGSDSGRIVYGREM